MIPWTSTVLFMFFIDHVYPDYILFSLTSYFFPCLVTGNASLFILLKYNNSPHDESSVAKLCSEQ